MYALYKELHPSTGVELAVYCHFFNNTQRNLVVAATNQLSVYKLNDAEGKAEKATELAKKKKKLECLMTFPMYGHIMSLEPVTMPSSSRDSLVISFQQAKLSMVEYDPSTHDLKTLSLHCFEEESLKDGHSQNQQYRPEVRVDPEARCAAMLLHGTRLVVLPFRRDLSVEDADNLGGTKPPIMSSYIIDLRKLDEKITGVIDLQFLHGYYEPTILILYEPLPTWSGRIAVRKDSCSIVAISLNMQEKVHPIIWSQSSLPFDCIRAYPVQKPIGGVVIFACNSLIYLNQSFPPYGVSLNSLVENSTDFILKPQEGVTIALDCSQACFITPEKLVVSLKGGELYVLTLVADTMRAVRSFHLDKAAASVLTTSMCHCEDGYIFLGSRLGNSLLLKYTMKGQEGVVSAGNSTSDKQGSNGEPATKKQKKDNITDWMASDISALDDPDELEVYGSQPQSAVSPAQITQYAFEVCDSIMNIGPCGECVMGEPAFLSEEFSTEVDPDLELVTTSGYGKNGAITVLQRTIRPQVVTTFELPGCLDMWTVMSNPGQELSDEQRRADDPLTTGHGFLLMSRDDNSMILRTGQEIMELDQSGFSTQGHTVFAGNMGPYILQVTANSVKLLEGVTQLQHIPIDFGSPVVWCACADPYAIIMSDNGHLMMLTLKTDQFGHGMRLACSRPPIIPGSRPVSLCAYKDVSGLFKTAGDRGDQQTTSATSVPETSEQSRQETPPPAPETSKNEDKADVDDEDELLYGDSDIASIFKSTDKTDDGKTQESSAEAGDAKKKIEPTYWAVVARENGTLEVYNLPEFKRTFLVKNFPMGHKVLVDSGQQSKDSKSTDAPVPEEMPDVRELLLVGLGANHKRPYLMARVAEHLFMYEAFSYPTPDTDHLHVRFKKINHGLILKERKLKVGQGMTWEVKKEKSIQRSSWLQPFDDISGYSGVFVCGHYPHWILMSARGSLRIHPMAIDGSIHCFAPFHNVNCPRGFLYFNKSGELRICVLPTHLSYDAPWPVRKVPLRCTPHAISYHVDSKTYSVVSSSQEICKQFVKVIGDGEKEFETHERDERFIYPMMDKFCVQLFSPVSWEPIPNTRLTLEDFEHVTCIKCVSLKSEGTLSGYKQYIALSTSYGYNEDVTARGRVIIYDVIEVVPEPGQPLTKNKMKIEYDKEQKGPVTALDSVQGFLISAVGQKIYIWSLIAGDLSGVAFIDTNVYIHQLTTIKNLILVADVARSITLLRFQAHLKVLSLVSRDYKAVEVYSAAFMVDNVNLAFLVSDRLKNMLIYSYQPEVRESHGGQRLLQRADINIDHRVNTFWRVKCKLMDPSTVMPISGPIESRHCTYFATLDGNMGYMLPLTEKVYRRLLMLQNALNAHLPHTAGLNPKGYRAYNQEYRMLANPQKNVLDGELLWRFTNLSLQEKNEITKRIGIESEQVLDDLLEIDRCTAHF